MATTTSRIKSMFQVDFRFWTCLGHLTLTPCAKSVLLTCCPGPGLNLIWLAESSDLSTHYRHFPFLGQHRLTGQPNRQQPSHSPEVKPCCCPEVLGSIYPLAWGPSKSYSNLGCQPSFLDLVIWALAPPLKGIGLSSLPAILPSMSLPLTMSSSNSRHAYRNREAE